jgi:hypothetical protein
MTQAEIQGVVRSICVEAEAVRLNEIRERWRGAASKYAGIVAREAYTPPVLAEIVGHDPLLTELASAPMFKNSFEQLPTSFAMVELANVIAPQRSVNLSVVESIKHSLAGLGEAGLLEACLSSKCVAESPRALQQAPNMAVFSAPSADFRFLGGYVKPIDASDVKVAHAGGAPAAAVILLVGYGSACANVIKCGDRVVLNNGFHRAYALHALGVERMPVVVQNVQNPELEFPPAVAGLPREYLIGHRRPVVLRDFFDDELVTVLEEKPRHKMVEIQWGTNQIDVPL